ncbi:MAG TPA: anti-sigma factor [Bryobacteraceae bacterium]|jgi:hypothetical protein|nr:anti-sigma factor [Bryobacteraceae bacterium]
MVNRNHCTADEYAYFAIGSLEGPENDMIRGHLRDHCEICAEEIKDALEFWYIFAALTERTQLQTFSEPTPMLRDRVIGIGRSTPRPTQGRTTVQTFVRVGLRMAAGVVITAGAATLSWNIAKSHGQKDISAAQARADQQMKKLESENNALRNLVVAARNAPAVFPGKESIVSVQDPYIVRDLQKARQTEVAISAALNDERAKAADLEKRLYQTTSLLASATHDRQEADRRYRKAFDATMEKESGATELSSEIETYSTRIQDLESQIGRYRTLIDSQNKRIVQHLQMVSLLQSRSLCVVQLHAAGTDQIASGTALIADDSRVAFFPANLPEAPAGRTYQLWLIRDKGTEIVSAGTFSGVAKELPSLQFASKVPMAGVKSLAVTEEPAGGSPAPTGRKLMVGTTTKG